MSDVVDDLIEDIADVAGKAKRVSSGDKILERQNVADMAQAAKVLNELSSAADTASIAAKPGSGLRFRQITPVYR